MHVTAQLKFIAINEYLAISFHGGLSVVIGTVKFCRLADVIVGNEVYQKHAIICKHKNCPVYGMLQM